MLCLSAFYWLSENSIGIKIIENEDVVHSSAGNEGETSGEISGDHTFQLIDRKDSGTDLVVSLHVASRRKQGRFELGLGLGCRIDGGGSDS